MSQNPPDPQNPSNEPVPDAESQGPGAPLPPSEQTPPPPPSYGSPQQPAAPSYGSPQQPPASPPPPPGGFGQSSQPGGYGQAPPPPSAYPSPQQGGFPPPPPPGPGPQAQYGQPGPGYGQAPPQGPGGFPAAPSYGGPTGPWAAGQPPFSVGTAISYGWNAFKANAGPWIGAILIVAVIAGLANWLLNPSVQFNYDAGDYSGGGAGGFGAVEYSFVGQLLAGLAGILTYLLTAVLTQGAVHKVNGRFDGFGAFTRFDHAGPLFLSALLVGGVNLVLGLLAVVTPFLNGILSLVWGVLATFVLYIAADRGLDPIASVQESIKLVTSNIGSVIVLWLATIGLVIAGIIVICGTGLIIVAPLLTLAWAFAYKSLSGQQVAPA